MSWEWSKFRFFPQIQNGWEVCYCHRYNLVKEDYHRFLLRICWQVRRCHHKCVASDNNKFVMVFHSAIPWSRCHYRDDRERKSWIIPEDGFHFCDLLFQWHAEEKALRCLQQLVSWNLEQTCMNITYENIKKMCYNLNEYNKLFISWTLPNFEKSVYWWVLVFQLSIELGSKVKICRGMRMPYLKHYGILMIWQNCLSRSVQSFARLLCWWVNWVSCIYQAELCIFAK